MNKYVAFLDILGFKDKMKRMTQTEAENFIRSFSQMLYDEWVLEGLNQNDLVNGFIVSDSIIVHTKDTFPEALKRILNYIITVCQKCFSHKGILLRCAITKGEYSHLEATGFENLQKGLIVGSAYIEAYTLESASKTSAIITTGTVRDDIEEYFPGGYTFEQENTEKDTFYLLKWLFLDYLLVFDNLSRFCEKAIEADWIPLHYNTLYLCFSCEKNVNKRDQIFYDICRYIRQRDSNYYNVLDKFISKAFEKDVNARFQKMFSRFLRMQIKSAD